LSYTAANVPLGGRAYTIVGPVKRTVTDITVTTNSETVTAADLGLSAIFDARARIQTGQATDTGVYATATINNGANITLAEFAAAGTAATTAAATVIRVIAEGY